MTRVGRITLILISLMICGCSKKEPPQRNIVLEVAASMPTMFDTPMTRSRELYSRYCSVCHGTEGKGDGFNAYNLNPKPRNFTDSSFIIRIDTALIRETITKGGGGVGLSPLMPPWGRTLSKEDIKLLAEYVVSLSKQ